jgi:hypothetical protein
MKSPAWGTLIQRGPILSHPFTLDRPQVIQRDREPFRDCRVRIARPMNLARMVDQRPEDFSFT